MRGTKNEPVKADTEMVDKYNTETQAHFHLNLILNRLHLPLN